MHLDREDVYSHLEVNGCDRIQAQNFHILALYGEDQRPARY
jgi:hypothetical protein